MRDALIKTLINLYKINKFCFLTGDVGYKALEPLRDKLGKNFINAGISEQNMINVAAGLFKSGHNVFVYTIAPFLYARPFEQIRNNIGFNNLPICLIGNGGGFAYGPLGPSHHAIDDCASMSSIGINVVIPCFDNDVFHIIQDIKKPTYLRLGQEIKIIDNDFKIPSYQPIRKVFDGNSDNCIFAVGPLVSFCINAVLSKNSSNIPTIYSVSEYNEESLYAICDSLENKNIYIFEEHCSFGSFAMFFSYFILKNKIFIKSMDHFFAKGYISGKYGSQEFHRKENKIDYENIKSVINEL